MLLFFLTVTALAALAYYVFGSRETEGTEDSGAPANRTRDVRQRTPRREGGPDIHEKKVRKKARDTFRSAVERVQSTEGTKDMQEIAKESYFLAESLRKMFSSGQFFEKRTRFDSFRTAIKAAEDVRDRLIDRQKKEMRQTDAVIPSVTSYVGDKYAKNATESALMIAWCAGGLIGKSRRESAQEAFRVSVSTEDVQRWERFEHVLRKESEHHMLDPPEGEVTRTDRRG